MAQLTNWKGSNKENIFFFKKKRKEKETSTACAQVTAYLSECQDLGFPLGL